MAIQFFKSISRIKWVPRWSLLRNTEPENVMEHSWEVATLAHILGCINNEIFEGTLSPDRLAVLGMYHDCSEMITGDMPTPAKYHSKAMTKAYKCLEGEAQQSLLSLLPMQIKQRVSHNILESKMSDKEQKILKAADYLAAYCKAQREIENGNAQYRDVLVGVTERLNELGLPEVGYFLNDGKGHYAINKSMCHHDKTESSMEQCVAYF
ncbi:5'-deoxynucleotidase [Marinibactrum halimedae]|uniref:5'-deoxynucleotidase n=1 Tax=Marinibactrum halimedae TaxID=1444977 RepID=A0AA37TAC8_9GAMM|nr:5'-deoxynucleotidase [Marinibactrum halimedae]MCD9458935.1 5'-deoxynucleotidase [Marinibactrum halimedae]GLS27782.1 5'-deoxynucleotidase [Marinibactrum halimedae]